jgi:hypothetical protein
MLCQKIKIPVDGRLASEYVLIRRTEFKRDLSRCCLVEVPEEIVAVNVRFANYLYLTINCNYVQFCICMYSLITFEEFKNSTLLFAS